MLAIQAAEAGESLSAFLRGRIVARDQWEGTGTNRPRSPPSGVAFP